GRITERARAVADRTERRDETAILAALLIAHGDDQGPPAIGENAYRPVAFHRLSAFRGKCISQLRSAKHPRVSRSRVSRYGCADTGACRQAGQAGQDALPRR